MRLSTLTGLVALALALAPRAEAQCTGTEGVDFQRVTIDEINAISEDDVAALNAGGADLTIAQIQGLLANDLVGETVEVTAVLLTDPYKSGVRSLNAQGFPNSIQAFVRDVAAATEGPEGMGLLINDITGTGTLQQFFVGDEITFCGIVNPFQGSGGYSIQIDLQTATGTSTTYGPDDPLLQPIVITTDDIHDTYDIGGDPQTQIDWSIFSDYINQYVRFEGIEVLQGILASNGRASVLLSSPGEDSEISQYDISVCFRNDRGPEYFPGGQTPACLDDPFAPPPTGTINLQGFLVFQGDDGAFDYSVPDEANFSIVPFEDEDFEIAVSPPLVTLIPTGIPSPSAGAVVRATVVPGTSGNTVASVVADYTTSSGGAGQIALANTSGDTYEGTITGLSAGDFVTYTVTATDNQSAAAVLPAVTYRVLDGPVSSILDIQTTPDGGVGASGLRTATPVAFDLDAVVQTVIPSGSTVIVGIQDDPSLGPFTGVEVSFAGGDPGLVPGDRITITEARVEENFGLTRLVDVTFTETGTGAPYGPKEVTTAMFAGSLGADTAEQHEGMLLRFETITITDVNADGADDVAGFGEFEFSTDGGTTELRVDDASNDIPATFNLDNLVVGQTRASIQGLLTYSFSNYKLLPAALADIGEVTITAADGGPEAGAARIAGAFPNPAASTARVRFELDAAGPVALRLYDVTGRVVATLAEGPFAAGAHEATAHLGHLAAGVYVLRLEAEGAVATARLAVVR